MKMSGGTQVLREKIDEYLNDLQIGGSAPATVRAYKYNLEAFVLWCEQNHMEFTKLTPKKIRLFRNYLVSKRLSASTINMIIYTTRSFYDYLVEEEIVPGNPVIAKRLVVSPERRKPDFLTDEELRKVLESLETKPPKIRLLFKTMLASGLRTGEVANLQVRDVVVQNSRVLLRVRRGKGGKERFAPVTDQETANELLSFREGRPPSEWLFGFATRTIQCYSEQIKAETGIDFHPHRLRHTLATNLLAQGVPLDQVQEVLGHENISTTRIYAQTLPVSFFRLAAKVS